MTSFLGVFYVVLVLGIAGFSIAIRARRIGTPDPSGAVRAVDAAVALGGKGSLDEGSALVIPFEQREFKLTGARYGKHGPQLLQLGTGVARPEGPRAASAFRDKPGATASMPRLPHVVLRRESMRDAWGKRLGLNVEPQTGDRAFDDAIYVEHDGDRVGVRYLLAIPELRARVLAIVDDHTSVVVNDEGDAVALRWSSEGAPGAALALRDAALELGRIADAIPPVRNLEIRPRGRSTAAMILSVSGGFMAFVVMIGTLLLLHRAPVDASFFRASIAVAMGLLFAAGVVGWISSQGRSRGLARFSWTILAAAVLSPFLSLSTLMLVNEAGVTADRREKVALYVYARTSKGRQSCYANIRPWRDGLTLLGDTRIACSFVGQIDKPHTGTVILGHGRLGWEWIEDVELDMPETPEERPGR